MADRLETRGGQDRDAAVFSIGHLTAMADRTLKVADRMGRPLPLACGRGQDGGHLIGVKGFCR